MSIVAKIATYMICKCFVLDIIYPLRKIMPYYTMRAYQ